MKKLTTKKRSKEEIYQSIIDKLKAKYGGNLSDQEVDRAAKNLINFCKMIIASRKL